MEGDILCSEKLREKIYQEFKQACDFFFENRRSEQGKRDHEQVDNLKAKEALCAQLEKHAAEKRQTPSC